MNGRSSSRLVALAAAALTAFLVAPRTDAAPAREVPAGFSGPRSSELGPVKTVHPAGETPTPDATVLSFAASRTRANNGLLKLPFDGSLAFTVELLSTQPAHFVLDVNGVFQ